MSGSKTNPTNKTDDSSVMPAEAGIQAEWHRCGLRHDYRMSGAFPWCVSLYTWLSFVSGTTRTHDRLVVTLSASSILRALSHGHDVHSTPCLDLRFRGGDRRKVRLSSRDSRQHPACLTLRYPL